MGFISIQKKVADNINVVKLMNFNIAGKISHKMCRNSLFGENSKKHNQHRKLSNLKKQKAH